MDAVTLAQSLAVTALCVTITGVGVAMLLIVGVAHMVGTQDEKHEALKQQVDVLMAEREDRRGKPAKG